MPIFPALPLVVYCPSQIGGFSRCPGYVLAPEKLSPEIARRIWERRKAYCDAVANAPKLSKSFPSSAAIETLYGPFECCLTSLKGKRVFRNWQVWGAKFWHFLNSNSFPIEDRFTDVCFDYLYNERPKLQSMHPGVERYLRYSSLFRRLMFEHESWVAPLMEADRGHAWSELKLWDKVLFIHGKLLEENRKKIQS